VAEGSSMILLDTCVLIWLAGSAGKLSNPATTALRENASSIYVSAISAWEISIKHARGKLDLGAHGPVEWFQKACKQHGLREIPIDAVIAGSAPLLSEHHNDPADRIIIATAVAHRLDIITPDRLISQYDVVKSIW
jgi:PIN domain nuclease of toxin-antitoxin system